MAGMFPEASHHDFNSSKRIKGYPARYRTHGSNTMLGIATWESRGTGNYSWSFCVYLDALSVTQFANAGSAGGLVEAPWLN